MQQPKKAQTDVIRREPRLNRVFLSIFSDYEAFKEAAEQFQPYVKFFATFDKSVSQQQTGGRMDQEPRGDWFSANAGGQRADAEVERGGFL